MLKNKLKIFKDSFGVSIISNLYNLLSMNLLPLLSVIILISKLLCK